MPPGLLLALAWPDARLPAAVALASGLALAATAVLRRHLREPPPPPSLREKVIRAAGATGDDDLEAALQGLCPAAPPDNRRRAVRRVGRLTPVRVADAPGGDPGAGAEGFVVDRASGGLRVATESPYPAGTVVYVRASAAPPGSPWVAVTVRHCRACEGFSLLGCAFRDPQPWSVLLLFG